MNNTARIIIYVCCLALVIVLGRGVYRMGYDVGYENGYSDTPIEVVEISGIELNTENGTYQITVTSGTKTFNLFSSGYMSSSAETEKDWETEYNELMSHYKHSVWHYEAQAEALRFQIADYRMYWRPKESDNFTVIIGK